MSAKASFPEIARRSVVIAGLLILALAPLAGTAAVQAAGEDDPFARAEALSREFMAAFAAKDMERVETLFAEEARVQRARVGPEGVELVQLDAEAWRAEAGESIAPVRDFRIEVLETTRLGFDAGVTVSVRFQATGTVAEDLHFVNDGVDSFSWVVDDGGDLRIVLYNSMEKLVFGPPG